MPLLAAEAAKLSNRYLEAGVLEELIVRDSMFAMLPFIGCPGKTYDYVREDETDVQDQIETAVANDMSVAFTAPYDTVPERGTKFVEVSARIRALVGDVDVDSFLDTSLNDTNNQKAIQIAAKAKVIRHKFARCVARGDSAVDTNSFDGLQKLVSSAQTIYAGTNGGSLDFDMLDELKDLVIMGADALVMHRKTWRRMKTLLRALNIQPEHVALPEVGITVPVYDGTPIIHNDYLPLDETRGNSGAVCTSIYAVRFNEADGFFGLYAGPNAGIVVQDIGIVQNKDSTRTRVKFYAGTGLKSTKSLARLAGIKLS